MNRVSMVLLLILCTGLATALAQTESAPVTTPVVQANASVIDSGDTAWYAEHPDAMFHRPGCTEFTMGFDRI